MPNSYNSIHTGGQHDAYVLKQDLIDLIYPVGAIYMSAVAVDPADIFGGTWEQISGKFLLAADATYAAGTTGGAETHSHTTNTGTSGGPSTNSTSSVSLSVAQMPYHGHLVRVWNNAGTKGNAYYYNGASVTYQTAALDVAGSWVNSGKQAAQSGHGDPGGGADPVGSGQGHSHTLNSHTHSQTSVGTSTVSTMPPYLSVYVWKRTA